MGRSDLILHTFGYNDADALLRQSIADLLDVIWPNTAPQASGQDSAPPTHKPELSAQSFCCYAEDVLVGYAGVVQKEIDHCGQCYRIAGLSCVATLPDYRGRGVGAMVVSAATKWIESRADIDLGIFTCDPILARLYCSAGGWEVVSDAILLGSHDAGALSSNALKVVVLMRLFSMRAKQNIAAFTGEPICLGFPVGDFL